MMKLSLPLALSLVDNAKQNGSGWKAICPAHPDVNPSLSLSSGDKQNLIIKCHAGCDYDDIFSRMRDRLVQRSSVYTYRNEDGEPIGRVTRKYTSDGSKRFYQSILDNENWKPGSSDDLKNTPYNLPGVLRAINSGKKIFIVEGEKDADNLIESGRVATCNAGGGGKWRDTHSEWLVGASGIYIIADNDNPGYNHAWSVYDSLKRSGIDCPIRVFFSPFGKDVTDHLILEHKLSELKVLERKEENELSPRIKSGSSFIFDSPAEVPAIWGKNGKEVLWAKGQGFMIVAPQGVGKTTLAVLLAEGLLGFTDQILEIPILPTANSVLYMAMDRPEQIASAMRRRFEQYGRDDSRLVDRLKVWDGPPEHDFSHHPNQLTELALSVNADVVFIDSLKDAAVGISKEETGQGWNKAIQTALINGIQVCILNHPVKRAGQELNKPMSLDEVYGNQWITAGLGSVLSLWGDRNSAFAELSHLKQPAIAMEPLTIRRYGKTGLFERIGDRKDFDWFFTTPHTVSDLAAEMFPGERSKANDARARRQVDEMLNRGAIVKHSEAIGGMGKAAVCYVLREPE